MAGQPFRMPHAYPGLPVYFYLGGARSQEKCLAFVTKVGEGTLALVCFTHDSYSVEPHVGVRHLDDPMLKNQEIAREAGGWDYCEFGDPLEQLGVLRQEVEDLRRQIASARAAK